nr:hypothetical protein [Tanacetum cinerariifolium]
MIKPDWSLSFEVMCDASDYVVGAVLGQRIDKYFKPIHYASKTMNEAQENYTMTKKDLLTSWDLSPHQMGTKYVLVAINYVSNWVEAQDFLTNDSRNVVNFLKKLFARFGIPKALISDRGIHFCNYEMERAMKSMQDSNLRLRDKPHSFFAPEGKPHGEA